MNNPAPNPLHIIIFLFAFRLFNSIIAATYFDPDEHWQSLEIAHGWVFGYGHVTWDWQSGLRNWVFVAPFVAAFWLLKALNLDSEVYIIYVPRVMQAGVAAMFDYGVYCLAQKFYKRQSVANWALIMSLVSWFNFSHVTRTISNVAEAGLTAFALYWWPTDPAREFSETNFWKAILLAGFCCLIRPSAVLNWVFPGVHLMIMAKSIDKFKIFLLTVMAALIMILTGLAIDSYFYGKFTLSWWNFVRINYLENVSIHFGQEPWSYYLIQAIPAMGFTMLPLIFVGIKESWNISGWLVGFFGSSLWLNSSVPHKEMRYLIPLMPLLSAFAGLGRVSIRGGNLKFKQALLFIVLVTNIITGIYFARFHQSGVVRVMDYLRREIDSGKEKVSVLFLMPCHSTPYYAYLHRNVPLRFLDCSPLRNEHGVFTSPPGYLDEADQFYKNPRKMIPSLIVAANPTLIVLYESLVQSEGELARWLKGYGFNEVWRSFNSHFSPDKRRSGDVLVYRWSPTVFIE